MLIVLGDKENEYVAERCRWSAVSSWIADGSAEALGAELRALESEGRRRDAETVLALLTCGKVLDAALAAATANNLRLSLIVAQVNTLLLLLRGRLNRFAPVQGSFLY